MLFAIQYLSAYSCYKFRNSAKSDSESRKNSLYNNTLKKVYMLMQWILYKIDDDAIDVVIENENFKI